MNIMESKMTKEQIVSLRFVEQLTYQEMEKALESISAYVATNLILYQFENSDKHNQMNLSDYIQIAEENYTSDYRDWTATPTGSIENNIITCGLTIKEAVLDYLVRNYPHHPAFAFIQDSTDADYVLEDEIISDYGHEIYDLLPIWDMTVEEVFQKYEFSAAKCLNAQKQYQRDYENARKQEKEELAALGKRLQYTGPPRLTKNKDCELAVNNLKSTYNKQEIQALVYSGQLSLSDSLKSMLGISKNWFDVNLDSSAYNTEPEFSFTFQGLSEDEFVQLKNDAEAQVSREFSAEAIRQEEARKRREEKKRKKAEAKQRDQQLRDTVLKSIPDNYIDLFPKARLLHRHFTLHIGPTNSGKSYEAVERLKTAQHGIYLAPLRLLAYEQYETLQKAGVPCSMVTGEERIHTENARVQSCTVEMASYSEHYDVAVIDEAQMVSEPSRGRSWTSAILGLCADEIIVCASDNAESILIWLIEQCGDTYDVVHHERKTPLVVESHRFRFPEDVQEGDALIVFSRRNVHAVAAELESKGIKTSIIYGALPYDVRHEQARLFMEGKTQAVVSTDAIGMGMNLPVRRIVFLELTKYDGAQVRDLTSYELKQIAGRAGRYGLYDTGYVTSTDRRKWLRKQLNKPDEEITEAVIGFPESLIDLDGKLSEILTKWDQIPKKKGYKKSDLQREIALAQAKEAAVADKHLLYDLITIPFDEENEKLLQLWYMMADQEGKGFHLDITPYIPTKATIADSRSSMDALESLYHTCDLLYAYTDKFCAGRDADVIMKRKKSISEKILKLLKDAKFVSRKCKYCGKKLPWNYPYGMCQKCHDKMYRNVYYDGYDDDDWEDGGLDWRKI